MRRPLVCTLGAAAGFAALTAWALESGEVVVLRTRGAEGAPRETRVWLAEGAGSLWLEAATPGRAWYRDLLAHPEVEIRGGARAGRYRATPRPGADERARLRRRLREKYGWADAFVGVVQDTSRSVAVELRPAGGPPAPP